MKLLFTNEGLRRKIPTDPDDEPTAGGPMPADEAENVAVMGERNSKQMRIALGTLVRQLRLRDGLTIAQLAGQADVSEDELRRVEHDPTYTARPRLIFKLSDHFKVSLMALSGTTNTVSRVLYNEAVRYAARSDDVSMLTPEEREALDAFVAVLNERTKV